MYATAEETSQLSEWCKEHSGVGSPSSCFSTETLIEQWFCLEDGTVILPREEFPREAQTESSCIYIGNKINFTLLHQSFPQTSLTLCHKNCFSPWFLPWGEGSDIGWSVCLNVWPPGFWGHTLWGMFLILFHTECWVIIRAWSPGISTKKRWGQHSLTSSTALQVWEEEQNWDLFPLREGRKWRGRITSISEHSLWSQFFSIEFGSLE